MREDIHVAEYYLARAARSSHNEGCELLLQIHLDGHVSLTTRTYEPTVLPEGYLRLLNNAA